MNSFRLKEILPIAAVIGLIIVFFYGMSDALIPLLFSAIIAYVAFPLVRKLEKRGVKRNYSALIVLGGIGLLIALILVIAVPPLSKETSEAIEAAPTAITDALTKLDEQLSRFGVHVPYDRASLQKFISTYSQKVSSDFFSSGYQIFRNALSNFASLLVFLLSFAMVPVFFFYMIVDSNKIRNFAYNIIPQSWQSDTEDFMQRADVILSGYFRGQLIVCAILSVLYTTALLLVGVKFALIIGIATGFLSVIPYIGYSMGFGAAILSVVAIHDDWSQLIWLIVAYNIVQFLESFIITPKIVGNEVGLTPFEAILALIIIGNLFGFIGLFFAIPMGGIAKLLIRRLMIQYKRTEFYRA